MDGERELGLSINFQDGGWKKYRENNFFFKEKIWKYKTCCKRAKGHMLHLFKVLLWGWHIFGECNAIKGKGF